MQCQAFILCCNEATTTIPNPIVGDVPCCRRCKERLEKLSAPRVPTESANKVLDFHSSL